MPLGHSLAYFKFLYIAIEYVALVFCCCHPEPYQEIKIEIERGEKERKGGTRKKKMKGKKKAMKRKNR